jgi:hypothetical protein
VDETGSELGSVADLDVKDVESSGSLLATLILCVFFKKCLTRISSACSLYVDLSQY